MQVYVFVDTQNLIKTLQEKGFELDFEKLFVYLSEELKSDKSILFFGYSQKNKTLYENLEQIGFELVFRPMYNGKANVDNDIVLHAVDRQNEYDNFVLVSNDGDFYNLIKYIKDKDKFKNIISPSRDSCSKLLRKIANNKIIFLDDIYGKVCVVKEKAEETQNASL